MMMLLMVGFLSGAALGLTGGGGAIIAVPLLIYAAQLPIQQAISLSLVAVAITAAFGVILQWKHRLIAWRAGMIVAIGGMLMAPVGTMIGTYLPDKLLSIVFSLLMLVIGWLMWKRSKMVNSPNQESIKTEGTISAGRFLPFIGVGVTTGLLTGLFGVGGGFLIVPALIFMMHFSMRQAIATSLFIIMLVSLSGIISHLLHHAFGASQAMIFIFASLIGMLVGYRSAKRLSAQHLQLGFSMIVMVLGLFMLVENMIA